MRLFAPRARLQLLSLLDDTLGAGLRTVEHELVWNIEFECVAEQHHRFIEAGDRDEIALLCGHELADVA